MFLLSSKLYNEGPKHPFSGRTGQLCFFPLPSRWHVYWFWQLLHLYLCWWIRGTQLWAAERLLLQQPLWKWWDMCQHRHCHCLQVSGGLWLLVGCLTSQQHASVSQGRICSDNFTCCHTEIEVADQTFHLTQSQYTDTGLTSPSADLITPGTWQGSQWSANF